MKGSPAPGLTLPWVKGPPPLVRRKWFLSCNTHGEPLCITLVDPHSYEPWEETGGDRYKSESIICHVPAPIEMPEGT